MASELTQSMSTPWPNWFSWWDFACFVHFTHSPQASLRLGLVQKASVSICSFASEKVRKCELCSDGMSKWKGLNAFQVEMGWVS